MIIKFDKELQTPKVICNIKQKGRTVTEAGNKISFTLGSEISANSKFMLKCDGFKNPKIGGIYDMFHLSITTYEDNMITETYNDQKIFIF